MFTKKKIQKSILFYFFLLVLTINVSAERPNYSYSETVFENLPEFPNDFYEIKELFETQQITAEQLGKEYYLQPELYPSWDFCSELYYNKTNYDIGRYGLGFYPSRFDVYNFRVGEPISFSSLAFASPGISLYQGLKLKTKDSNLYNITIDKPINQHILFSPTYPVFGNEWSTVIELTVTPYKDQNITVNVFEGRPNQNIENNWKNNTNNLYVSGNSLLSTRTPRLKIFFHSDYEPKTHVIEENDMTMINIFIIILFLVTLIFLGRLYVKKKRDTTEE